MSTSLYNETKTAEMADTKASTALLSSDVPTSATSDGTFQACFHCGTICNGRLFTARDKAFCCHGCLAVFELLTENGLEDFYQLSETAGVRVRTEATNDQFKYLGALTRRGCVIATLRNTVERK